MSSETGWDRLHNDYKERGLVLCVGAGLSKGCGLPDWPEMPFVTDFLGADDAMVDVGANVGLYSLLAASVEGVTVVAFEPDATSRQRAVEPGARVEALKRHRPPREGASPRPGPPRCAS